MPIVALRTSSANPLGESDLGVSDKVDVKIIAGHAEKLIEESTARWPDGGRSVRASLRQVTDDGPAPIAARKKEDKNGIMMSVLVPAHQGNSDPVMLDIKLAKSTRDDAVLAGSLSLKTSQIDAPTLQETFKIARPLRSRSSPQLTRPEQ